MRFYYYKDDNKKEIKKIDRDNIASDICQKAKEWHEDVQAVRTDFERIKTEIFPDTAAMDSIKLIPDVYEQSQTYKANIFKATYQNYDGAFDIEGQDSRSNNLAAIYKAALVYDFDKICLKQKLDDILDDWIYKGEAAAFVYWKKCTERRRETLASQYIDNKGNLQTDITKRVYDAVVHEGANVKRIDPLNLFFDKSMKKEWDKCGKIIRDFIPLVNILNNKKWKLTPLEVKELKDMVAKHQNDNPDDIGNEYNDIDTKVIGNTVEVLEYYGDYIIPEKCDIARNVIITIIAGKYVAQIEESEYPTSPIIFATYLERPDTLRGQSAMKPTFLLNELENRCCDLNLHCWHLTANPVMLSPKGMINKDQVFKAGNPYEFNQKTFDNSPPPRPIDFSAGIRGFDFQDYFKKKMEGATGISTYMQGTTGGPVRTASESTYIYSGQTTRLSRDAYMFSEYVILPIVKTFAKLKKEFEYGEKTVPVTIAGNKTFQKVDDEIRNGNYSFIIGTAQSSVEREQYTRKIFELLATPVFQSIVQRPEFPAGEFFKWVLNEGNYRQIESLMVALGLNEKIAQVGREMGVQDKNLGGFVNDMNSLINENIPEFANILQEQLADNEIPQPKEVADEVRQENLLV